ncbi:hypothetical protein HDU78_002031 [Chytriomyces hyalinus]|nr:hypothetical protein HDU78_002031 [Chytriomyces hyalinus]
MLIVRANQLFKRYVTESAEPEPARTQPEPAPSASGTEGPAYVINSNLPVVVTSANPEGFQQYERAIWQYAKNRLTCKQYNNNSICGSTFRSRSSCGTKTPFGISPTSIACKKCLYRPRLREACSNSGIQDLIDLATETSKLDDHCRAHHTVIRQKTTVTKAYIQPITNKKRPHEAIVSSCSESESEAESEKIEKMSNTAMNLADIQKIVSEHAKRVDEFMRTINTQMDMFREQSETLKKQIERNEALQRELNDIRKQLHQQQQQTPPQQPPQQQQKHQQQSTRAASRAARSASRGRPTESYATGPVIRPKNMNRTQNFNNNFKSAPSYKEIAAMSIRSDFNAPTREGPPPVRAESIKSCFVSLRFLKKEAKLNGPMKATRAIFRETFELPYIEDISPLGRGFSIAEIFFDGRHEDDIRQKLAAKEILLDQFNPLDNPPHQPDANEDTMKERMCARRAGVYRRARFALVKQAALEGCDRAMQARIRELAAPQRGNQSGSNTGDTQMEQ